MAKYFLSKQLRKRSFWLVASCIVIIAVLIGVAVAGRSTVRTIIANSPLANNPIISHGPLKLPRKYHPLPTGALAPRTASQGNPLDFTIDSGQDVALASDKSVAVNQEFAGNFTANDATDQSVTVHNGFASISIETYHVCNFVHAPTQEKMRNLLKNLGPGGIIRVGGGSVDITGWDGQSTRDCSPTDLEEATAITPPMIQHLMDFAHSIGWKVIWSVGLQLTPAAAADDAASAVSAANNYCAGK